jgi:hypothetical protein
MALLRSVFGASSKSSVDKTNKWEDELRERYDNVVNREKFKYDMNNDPLHNQYAQLYEQNAKLAMQDTVGQVSALTGGYGNSYAQTAGQAVYNQQMSGMNDKALELYQMALNQYNAEGDRLMQMYGITADQYQTEYNRIRDEVADEQWQKSFDESQRQYNLGLLMDAGQFAVGTAVDVGKFGANMAFDMSRAAVSDAQWEKSFGYQQERDAVADSQWQQNFDYQKQRDAVSDSRFAQELAYKYAALNNKGGGGGGDGDGDGNNEGNVENTSSNLKAIDELTKSLESLGDYSSGDDFHNKGYELIQRYYDRGDITEETALKLITEWLK